jgi:uncharacterized protein with PIN domain
MAKKIQMVCPVCEHDAIIRRVRVIGANKKRVRVEMVRCQTCNTYLVRGGKKHF